MPRRRDHWAYVPPPGERAAPKHRLTLRRNGKDWNGYWETVDGRLLVCSAYGSRTEDIGRRRNLQARAEALFADILDHPG